MKVIFCKPELTRKDLKDATVFFNECQNILNRYVANIQYMITTKQIKQLSAEAVDEKDLLVFFNSEDGKYDDVMLRFFKKYNQAQCRIWTIAMEKTSECRKPPEPITNKQSFDVSCRMENRNPLKNNIKAIAQLFARKIVGEMLSPLYRDEVLYFISHKRADGESIAAKLADGLHLLNRNRNVYRDVVRVEVGNDAQKDIDKHLVLSDVVIFLQTKQAQDSDYIMKELCYALVHDIPVLWIQIDGASYEKLKVHPGQHPILSYKKEEFDSADRLEEIVDEVEETCFQLMMNSSNQVYSYVEYLNDMYNAGKIKLTNDVNSILAYGVEYTEKTRDLYDSGIRKHYIQCYGRNPKETDVQNFINKVKESGSYHMHDKVFLLSNHGCRNNSTLKSEIIEENYNDYIMNLENITGTKRQHRNKRIILSGAFPDCDEIYKVSLIEALLVYSREIIKNGYTLVFGAHPTFQKLIFDTANLYAADVKASVEMHMDKKYENQYNLDDLREQCNLILADNLQKMRENMICAEKAELLICLGGMIKQDKSQQGVDIEIALARKCNIPVALVGTVGGRSSEYAFEKFMTKDWSALNSWEDTLNEGLFYSVNHRLMISRLLKTIEKG